ncbi:MAG TPA: hypothetical protein VNQ76_08775 [Planctomicrobium sp.]|nr:hypothetical protein [Planctomicrobium sp.]
MSNVSISATMGLLLTTLVNLIGCSGCQPPNDGPDRYLLTGKATFAGKPIPYGSIMLEPDESKGNRGPVGVADIRDGRYQIRDRKGHIGGPHVATILGNTGVRSMNPDEDTSLFPPYQISVDLPAKNSQCDFDVPEDAGGMSSSR